jgi:ABC-type transport system involved in cytochrome bd biosynthesis fused ATPase/permease subunit
VSFDVAAGSHVAIVGESGAGKSTLVGLLLGWHRPAAGTIRVDGNELSDARIAELRKQTAWVDPAVALWNRRLVDNLLYGTGSSPESARHLGWAIDGAELRELLERLPEGLQTVLGEGGALVSGGEGQRVRLGRAMLRSGVRLVILDEPFRGLDRDRRRRLLRRARELWQDATILCVTHDVGETLRFERVLVVEQGRVIEDGDPAHLAADPDSRYAAMLAAEHAVREGLWSAAGWRRLRIDKGRLVERGAPADEGTPLRGDVEDIPHRVAPKAGGYDA